MKQRIICVRCNAPTFSKGEGRPWRCQCRGGVAPTLPPNPKAPPKAPPKASKVPPHASERNKLDRFTNSPANPIDVDAAGSKKKAHVRKTVITAATAAAAASTASTDAATSEH